MKEIDIEQQIASAYTFGCIISLVNSNKTVRQLKHVVSQADNHELGILGPFLDVITDNRHVLEV